MKIGVIADTHGLLRPEAQAALAGCELIIHAGDLGRAEILPALKSIAPVRAVRGNVDRELWAVDLPKTEVVPVGEVMLYVLHDLHHLQLDPKAAGFHAVISGHSHQPAISTRFGVLYLNPGSAGPRRFKLPVTLAYLWIDGDQLSAEIVDLLPPDSPEGPEDE